MRLVLLLLALLLPISSLACVCTYDPLGQSTVDSAKQVFVFQLVSATYEPSSGDVVGEIRVIELLRGSHQGHRIRYYTSLCCGIRLDVGQFYVGFEGASTTEFAANPGNVLNLGENYSPLLPLIGALKEVLAGAKSWSQALGESANDRVLTLPPPPDPCPSK